MERRSGSEAGFSLLELMAVVTILGILLLIAAGSYALSVQRSASIACRNNRCQLERTIDLFAQEHSKIPSTLDDLTPYVKSLGAASECPSDRTVKLVYNKVTRTVSCPLHSN